MDAITHALADLGLATVSASMRPSHDTRYAALANLIRQRLRTPDGTAWLPGERLVIFTEYKTTLDALVHRLRPDFRDDGAIVQLFGSGDMDEREKEAVFNDPASAARILVATDAASEGLNLQRTARYLHHNDIPWSPSRLEQRNVRIDRYGQSRDVTVSHFISDDALSALRRELDLSGDAANRRVEKIPITRWVACGVVVWLLDLPILANGRNNPTLLVLLHHWSPAGDRIRRNPSAACGGSLMARDRDDGDS